MNNTIETNMINGNAAFCDGPLYQYDRGIKLRLINAPDGYNILIEMCNAGDKKATHSFPYSGADIAIPDELLADGRDLQFYVSVTGESSFNTLLKSRVKVNRRPSR